MSTAKKKSLLERKLSLKDLGEAQSLNSVKRLKKCIYKQNM